MCPSFFCMFRRDYSPDGFYRETMGPRWGSVNPRLGTDLGYGTVVPFLDDSPIEPGHVFFPIASLYKSPESIPIYPHKSWRNPHQILEFILTESDLLVNLPELLKRRSSLSELFAS